MLGLKKGTVYLCEHENQWENEARNTIARLKSILGNIAYDIQHVGSTAIPSIKAKPIIDIAVAVDDFGSVLALEKELKDKDFYYRPSVEPSEQLLFAAGSFYDGTGDLQTHFIHVVRTGSMEWINYINFRDYLNQNPAVAKEYESLKVALAKKIPNDRENYTKGKHNFVSFTLRKALVKSYLGKTVDIKIDRPIGYVHKKENYSLIYPINYGYIPEVLGGDGEELDVYLLGVNEPVTEYTAKIIGIAHREDDVEDKLIAAPENMHFSKEDIEKSIHFQEQYYKTMVEVNNSYLICDVKEIITQPDILKLLVPSVFNPTEERLLNRAKKYGEDEETNVYAYKEGNEYKGIVVFKTQNNSATILDIAVKPDYQGRGIGSKLIDFIFNSFNVNSIIAETDDDAIGFYKKYGFTVTDTKVKFDTKRYTCVKKK